MVIGDPNQAIYGFRGARPEYSTRFMQDWPGALTLSFSETYRLPPPLRAASQGLLPQAGDGARGEPPGGGPAGGAPGDGFASGGGPDHCPAHRGPGGGSGSPFLDDHRLRYQDSGGEVGFKDVRSFSASMPRGPSFGKPSAWRHSLRTGPGGGGSRGRRHRPGGPAGEARTLHVAKGLEFPYVFIAGCETGSCPFRRRALNPGTRRRSAACSTWASPGPRPQRLLTRARSRTLWGKRRRTHLSPLAEMVAPVRQSQGTGRGRRQKQGTLFPELRPPSPPRGRRRTQGLLDPILRRIQLMALSGGHRN